IFLAPVAAVIPATATSAALVYVGILMLQGLSRVDFNDLDQLVPVFVMLLAMPISGSIGHGIALAMILYTLIKLLSGKGREVSVLTYVISVLFIIKFFAVV
ncbi:MAG: NCS2 family permease, partial [Firmicutes bacterium]|nr:NCS2 family permease [Bacillota bacterium]